MATESRFLFAFTPDWAGRDNMELDSYLCGRAIIDRPLLRLYTWRRPTISAGYHQNIEKRIDLVRCAEDGIDVVTRPTGGRELLHGHDICFSIIWPARNLANSLMAKEYFIRANGILIDALEEFGVKASWSYLENRGGISKGPCFAQVDSGEISFGGKKLIASAQRVFESAILQQCSMPLVKPSMKIVDYLNYKGDMKGLQEKLDSMTALFYDITGNEPPAGEIASKFQKALEKIIGACPEEVKIKKINDDYELTT